MNKDELLKRMRKYMWIDALIMLAAVAALVIYIVVFHFITKYFEIPGLAESIITVAFIECIVCGMQVVRKKVREHFFRDIDFLQEKNCSEK